MCDAIARFGCLLLRD